MVANAYAAERETPAECETHQVSLDHGRSAPRPRDRGRRVRDAPALRSRRRRKRAHRSRMVARAWATQTARRHLRRAARSRLGGAKVLAADYHAPADSPLLTEDAAIMLVDQTLAACARTPRARATRPATPLRTSRPRACKKRPGATTTVSQSSSALGRSAGRGTAMREFRD